MTKASKEELDARAAQLETFIRDCHALCGKLDEALPIALRLPNIYDHELRVMIDSIKTQITGYRLELRRLYP